MRLVDDDEGVALRRFARLDEEPPPAVRLLDSDAPRTALERRDKHVDARHQVLG